MIQGDIGKISVIILGVNAITLCTCYTDHNHFMLIIEHISSQLKCPV